MPEIARNFIITCGTSQLGARSLAALSLSNKRPYEQLRDQPSHQIRTTADFQGFPPRQNSPAGEHEFIRFLAKSHRPRRAKHGRQFCGIVKKPNGGGIEHPGETVGAQGMGS